jgi:hypothetical protein
MSTNNFKIEFPQNNQNLLVPIPDQVVELNRFILESNSNEIDNNSLINVPYFGGPVNYQTSNKTMPVLQPHSLSDPILMSLPDEDVPNGPFILLNKSLEDGSRCTSTKAPENIITNDFLFNTQNVIDLSKEYGLPPIPTLENPNNVNLHNFSLNKLDNTPEVGGNSNMNKGIELPFQKVTNPQNKTVSYGNTIINQGNITDPIISQKSVVFAGNTPQVTGSLQSAQLSQLAQIPQIANPIQSAKSLQSAQTSQMIADPVKRSRALGDHNNLFKKLLMYLSMALLIYVIYLVISKRR